MIVTESEEPAAVRATVSSTSCEAAISAAISEGLQYMGLPAAFHEETALACVLSMRLRMAEEGTVAPAGTLAKTTVTVLFAMPGAS